MMSAGRQEQRPILQAIIQKTELTVADLLAGLARHGGIGNSSSFESWRRRGNPGDVEEERR